MSVNFNIPFNGLCQGMQVMHRSGFSVTALNTDYVKNEPQNQTTISDTKQNAENVELSATKSTSPKSAQLKSENKAESTKTEKKSAQKNKRRRRK